MSGKPKYDWVAIQAHYDAGNRLVDCMKKYGFSQGAWCRVVREGKINRDPKRIGRKRLNLLGQKFTRLTVIDGPVKGKRYECAWVCKCSCGNIVNVPGGALMRGKGGTKSCGCLKIRKNRENPCWTGCGEISGKFWSRLVWHSNADGRDFAVKISVCEAWELFKKQDGKCAISGVDLSFAEDGGSETTASLDRIDSSKDYEIGNVQWVHKWVNVMKWDFTESEFFNWIETIHDHQQSKHIRQANCA